MTIVTLNNEHLMYVQYKPLTGSYVAQKSSGHNYSDRNADETATIVM